jgi:3-methyladenine DNA glycosylase AlkD
MTAKEILAELKAMGSANYKRLLFDNYGVKEPCYGVKIGDMKKIQKRIKKDYQLALDLYDTGNYDAMYLAGLIADDERMTKADLRRWVGKSNAGALCGATVPWVAAGSSHGRELALEWIESEKNHVAAAGWLTLSGLVAIKDDTQLDLAELKQLLLRVQKTIHKAPDTVRFAMNAFVIAVGSYVKSMTDLAIQIGQSIGKVTADLGNNDCQIPFAPEYILKVKKRGTIGKKRKTVKC